MKKAAILIGALVVFLIVVWKLKDDKTISQQLKSPITITPTITLAVTPIEDDNDKIKEDIKKELITKYGPNANKLEITVSKVAGDYAKGTSFAEGEGGGLWFAAKIGNQWKLIYDGNGIIGCEDLSAHPDFPSSLIPSCFDKSLQKLINR
jgi:hypothetical protein